MRGRVGAGVAAMGATCRLNSSMNLSSMMGAWLNRQGVAMTTISQRSFTSSSSLLQTEAASAAAPASSATTAASGESGVSGAVTRRPTRRRSGRSSARASRRRESEEIKKLRRAAKREKLRAKRLEQEERARARVQKQKESRAKKRAALLERVQWLRERVAKDIARRPLVSARIRRGEKGRFPGSPYSLFSSHEYPSARKEVEETRGSDAAGQLTNVSRVIAARWKALTPEQKQHWTNEAQKKIDEYRANQDLRPKRPLTPYLRFALEHRRGYIRENPSAGLVDASRASSADWKSMDGERKKSYYDAYQREMEEWKPKYEAWQKRNPQAVNYKVPSYVEATRRLKKTQTKTAKTE